MKKIGQLLFALSLSFSLCACKKKDTKENNNTTTKITTKKTTWEKTVYEKASYEKMTFGTYPQTLVSDTSIIDNLNSLAGEVPTRSDYKDWTGYGYGDEGEYMWYRDIDLDNDGINDYRGIYFIEYISANIRYSSDYAYYYSNNQLNCGYDRYITYWFKYEPIEWLVVKEENGKKMLISNQVVNSFSYVFDMEWQKKFEHNGGVGFGTDYSLSNIRLWLNNDFYNLAFNSQDKSKISLTLVDNSKNQGKCDEYDCPSSNDNVFLLSYAEVLSIFKTDEERATSPTDFALIHNLLYSSKEKSTWWLRGVISETDCAAYVSVDGYFMHENNPHHYMYGVRPVIYIND